MADKKEKVEGPGTAMATTTAAEVPDYIKARQAELGPRGFDAMETRDVMLPRLALCQPMTPQRQKGRENYIPGLEEGHFFNTITGRIYGEKVKLIPLFFYKSRIFFKDINEGGGIICQAPDGKSCQLNQGGPCLHNTWGPNGQKPECTEFFNYPSLILPELDLAIVSLKSTGIKQAKLWNSMMRMRGADMFAGVYEMASTQKPGPGGQQYYAWVIKNAEEKWASPDQLGIAENQYVTVYQGIASGMMRVHTDGLESEAAATDM